LEQTSYITTIEYKPLFTDDGISDYRIWKLGVCN